MTLYEDDFVSWSRQQAALLRSMPTSEGLDIEHLVDEIDGLGRLAISVGRHQASPDRSHPSIN